jgi:subtilisin family serine protease
MFCACAAGNNQRGSTAMNANDASPASSLRGTTCAAGRSDDLTSDFSAWGDVVDVKAPGENVSVEHVAGYWDGTSMSTPIVAGSLSCLRSVVPSAEAKRVLYASARKTAEPVHKEGYGVVDLKRAAALISPQPQPTPTPPSPPQPDPALPEITPTKLGLRTTRVDKAYAVRKQSGLGLGIIRPE